MPKLPEKTFLNKKQKLVKSTKSTTAPRKTTKSKCPKLSIKEFEVKQNEGRHGTIHSSRMYSLESQLLVDPRDTTPTNVHVANAKQVLKTAGTNQSIMYSMVDSIRTMEPATFSEGRNRFSQDLDEHIHPVLSYWYRLTETPPVEHICQQLKQLLFEPKLKQTKLNEKIDLYGMKERIKNE